MKYFYHFINVWSIFLFSVLALNAQELEFFIFDSDDKDVALIGATAQCKSGTGASSDDDGKILLNACEGDVKISYLGYTSRVFRFQELQKLDTIFLSAANNVLNAVIVTASNYEEAASSSIISIEQVDDKRLAIEDTPDLSNFLNRVNGVQVTDGQANIRGGSGYSYGAGSRVLTLLDGLPILQGDAGLANWRDMPTEIISNIEILKGASSILYGSSAMNGVIHAQTAWPESKPKTKVAMRYQMFGAPPVDSMQWWDSPPGIITGSVSHLRKIGKLDFVISAFYYDEESFFKYKRANTKRTNIKLRYRIRPEFTVGVSSNINIYEGDNPFYWENYGNGTLIADTSAFSPTSAKRFNIDPFVQYSNDRLGTHRLQGRFYSINNGVEMNRANSSQQYYLEYKFNKHFDKSGIIFSAGALGQILHSDAQLYSNSEFEQYNYGAYVQIDKTIGEKLRIQAGLRYEYNKTLAPDSIPGYKVSSALNTFDKTVGRVGLNYKVNEFANLRASWGQAYRYPTIAERFITANIGFEIFPNPELKPESGWSAEIGYKQGFRLLDFQGFFDFALFQMEYDDMMEFNLAVRDIEPRFGFESNNIGGTIIRGVEITSQATKSLSEKTSLSFNIGYNYIDPKYKIFTELLDVLSTSDKNVLKYRQRHQAKAHVRLEHSRFSIGTTYRLLSKTEAVDILFYGTALTEGVEDFDKDHNDTRHILDAFASYEFDNQLKFQVNVKNITNEFYTLRPARVEPIRSFTFSVSKIW